MASGPAAVVQRALGVDDLVGDVGSQTTHGEAPGELDLRDLYPRLSKMIKDELRLERDRLGRPAELRW